MDKKLSDDALTRNDGEAGLAAARGTGNGGGSGKITGVATTSSRPSTSALGRMSKRKMSKAERKRLAKLKMNGGVAAVRGIRTGRYTWFRVGLGICLYFPG